MKRQQWRRELQFLKVLTFSLLLTLATGCKHDWSRAEEFARSIRCGMTESEIHEAARRLGVPEPAVVTQRHFPGHPLLTVKPHELDFIDVLLENGKAVAVQRGNYISFTTGMEFGVIRMLCGAPTPQEKTLRDLGPSGG